MLGDLSEKNACARFVSHAFATANAAAAEARTTMSGYEYHGVWSPHATTTSTSKTTTSADGNGDEKSADGAEGGAAGGGGGGGGGGDLSKAWGSGGAAAYCDLETLTDPRRKLAALPEPFLSGVRPLTVRHLLDAVETCLVVFERKREELDQRVERMEKALAVLDEAEDDSDKLRTAVTELRLFAEERRLDYARLKEVLEKEEEKVELEEQKLVKFRQCEYREGHRLLVVR